MSTPYADMSYDELNAYITNGARLWTETEDVLDEMERKSAVMTAICKLAAELDEEGWVLVPREATGFMIRAGCHYAFKTDVLDVWDAMVQAAPALDQRETP